MPCLLDLSLEILEMMVLKLDSAEDVIRLGSSCRDLARTVGQEGIWRGIFSKTELVDDGGDIREDLVRRITTFLTSLDNREAIFSLLHQTIYEHYPATSSHYFTVSFPPSPQLQSVSDLGLELLALTGRQEARHKVHKVKVSGISPSLLTSLASLMKERITALEVTSFIYCRTEDEAKALVSLLEGCSTWRVKVLDLYGEVRGQTWQGLGRQMARGRVKEVRIRREMVGNVGKGRGEDIRAVWEKTEEWIWRSDFYGVEKEVEEEGEEGWRRR